MFEDKNGYMWFGTVDGVSRYDGNKFTHYTTKEGLNHNWVFSILEASDGLFWFGTEDGVDSYDGTQFVHYNVVENQT